MGKVMSNQQEKIEAIRRAVESLKNRLAEIEAGERFATPAEIERIKIGIVNGEILLGM